MELFQTKPTKALKGLMDAGVIGREPADIAKFLAGSASDLDAGMVGEVLGGHEDLWLSVMHAYVDLDDYTGMNIDDALRKLLGRFKLPGEAQKIDRIVEKFAARYCSDNPGRFRNADGAYMLGFSIIMLNTDAHHPSAERKLDRDGFVMMNC